MSAVVELRIADACRALYPYAVRLPTTKSPLTMDVVTVSTRDRGLAEFVTDTEPYSSSQTPVSNEAGHARSLFVSVLDKKAGGRV